MNISPGWVEAQIIDVRDKIRFAGGKLSCIWEIAKRNACSMREVVAMQWACRVLTLKKWCLLTKPSRDES